MPCFWSASAVRPAVTCSPDATTVSYSRASNSGLIALHCSTSLLVAPAIADTTTATWCLRSTSALILFETLMIRSMSATEVPPNFSTMRATGPGGIGWNLVAWVAQREGAYHYSPLIRARKRGAWNCRGWRNEHGWNDRQGRDPKVQPDCRPMVGS